MCVRVCERKSEIDLWEKAANGTKRDAMFRTSCEGAGGQGRRALLHVNIDNNLKINQVVI